MTYTRYMDERLATRLPETVGKILLTIILIFVSLTYFSDEHPWTIIDGADLLFHEAGHFLWAFLGQFMGILGGSLTQLLIPIGIGLYFAARKSWYSTIFCVYWLGINLVYVAIYIGDAQAMILPLINDSSIHDWNYLLTQTGLLSFDSIIGNAVRSIGALTILISEVAMGIHILRLFKA